MTWKQFDELFFNKCKLTFFRHNPHNGHEAGYYVELDEMDAKRKRLQEIMCELQPGGGAKEGDNKQERHVRKDVVNYHGPYVDSSGEKFIYPESGHYVQRHHHLMVRRNVNTKNVV